MKVSLVSLPLLALPFLACSSGGGTEDDGAGSGDCADLLAGDLVITEVMANPAGEDRGFEYFEVYNASSATIDLGGLTLVYALPDGSDEQTHATGELSIEAGAYLALGTAEPDALPDYVDYGFANDLGSLRNAGALLALRCGETEIDRMVYPSMEGDDGVSFGLDGANAPDHIANDDVANFCPATASFAEGLFGSPGAANEPCNPAAAPGTCTDEDGERATVPPAVGDLVITEFMASPLEADATREWFEVYAAAEVDLNGLVAGREPGTADFTVETTDCLRVAAGDYVLFARDDVAETNGGLPEVTQVFDFTLAEDRTLFIGIGDQVLDQITMTPAMEGRSTALDPDLLDPEDNDDPASWALCAAAYGEEGNTGTPGASNAACGGGGGGDTCLDGGTARALVPPGPGDIRISEHMPNPDRVLDGVGEWFELEVLANVDLNGLEIGQTVGDVDETVNDANCLRFNAGSFVLFAVNLDDEVNGGLPAVDFETNQTLGQSAAGDSLFIGHGGTVLDDISWAQADVPVGASLSRDPGGDTFCPGVDPYGLGDLGTPRAANPDCP
jgi:hypothetical protein